MANLKPLSPPPAAGDKQSWYQRLYQIITKGEIQHTATGSGTPGLGTNCPAVNPNTPYTWIKLTAPDGSVVYVPAWK